jgi:hypothetical protein
MERGKVYLGKGMLSGEGKPFPTLTKITQVRPLDEVQTIPNPNKWGLIAVEGFYCGYSYKV